MKRVPTTHGLPSLAVVTATSVQDTCTRVEAFTGAAVADEANRKVLLECLQATRAYLRGLSGFLCRVLGAMRIGEYGLGAFPDRALCVRLLLSRLEQAICPVPGGGRFDVAESAAEAAAALRRIDAEFFPLAA